MNLKTLAFIIRKLTLSKRNKGIVHIISLISLTGVAVVSFALIVVLSVFNGFTDVAEKMLEKTCPPLLIEPAKGKVIPSDIVRKITDMQYRNDKLQDTKNKGNNPISISRNQFRTLPVISATAMISVSDSRSVAVIEGIDSSYLYFNPLDSMIINGKDVFNMQDSLFCIMGINQAVYLGLNKGAEKMNIPVKITVPDTKNDEAIVVEDKLSSTKVIYQASFQSHSELDDGIVFIHIDKARQLLNMNPDECSALYILPQKGTNINKLKTDLQKQTGNTCSVKTILEQEPVYFRIVRSEKLAVYIILAFIIFIACINTISTVIILHIQKEKMNKIFRTMGMRLKDLRKIYFSYGITINTAGCLIGITAGLILCLLQQHFGLVKLAEDSFVVDAFPVKIMIKDIIIAFILVFIIGGLSVRTVSSRIKEKI